MSIMETMQNHHRGVRERLGMAFNAKPVVVPRKLIRALPAPPNPIFHIEETQPTLVTVNWTTGKYPVEVTQQSEPDGDLADNISVINGRWRNIIREVSKKHGVSILEIRGRYRDQRIVKARHEVFYRMRKETAFSLPEIGRRVGGFDHATVYYALSKHAARIADGTAI